MKSVKTNAKQNKTQARKEITKIGPYQITKVVDNILTARGSCGKKPCGSKC